VRRVIYTVNQCEGGYWVDYFDSTEDGQSPDMRTWTLTLTELIKFLQGAEASTNHLHSPTIPDRPNPTP
jgi:hypothetical protein